MLTVKNLQTERLKLKKITINDYDNYVDWKSQEEYHQFLPSKPKVKDEYKSTLRSIIAGYEDKEDTNLLWGIFKDDKLIGSVSIEDWNTTHKWCEIGWGLNPKFQKQGYAYEAVQCLIAHIFDTLKMNRISIVIWDGNNSSKRLAEKLGFMQEGIERNARIKNDKYIDLYCYGLLKGEWNFKHE